MKSNNRKKVSFSCPCDLAEFCTGRSDREIVEFAKTNKECYRLIVERYEEKLSRYVRRMCGAQKESIEDILQDIFIKVFVNLNSYRPELEFSSWIYRIAHNETINYWRKNKKKNELVVSYDADEFLGSNISDKRNVEREVFGKLNGEIVFRALGNIDKKYRDVIEMNQIKGKSYSEIAEALGKPIGTVGTLINRGRKILREKLENEGFSREAFVG